MTTTKSNILAALLALAALNLAQPASAQNWTYESVRMPSVSADPDVDSDGCSKKIDEAQKNAREGVVDRATDRIQRSMLRPASARIASCIDGLLALPSLALSMDPLGFLTNLIAKEINRAIDRACSKITNRVNELKAPIYNVKLPNVPGLVDGRVGAGGQSSVDIPGVMPAPKVDQGWWTRMRTNVGNYFTSAPPPQAPGK